MHSPYKSAAYYKDSNQAERSVPILIITSDFDLILHSNIMNDDMMLKKLMVYAKGRGSQKV